MYCTLTAKSINKLISTLSRRQLAWTWQALQQYIMLFGWQDHHSQNFFFPICHTVCHLDLAILFPMVLVNNVLNNNKFNFLSIISLYNKICSYIPLFHLSTPSISPLSLLPPFPPSVFGVVLLFLFMFQCRIKQSKSCQVTCCLSASLSLYYICSICPSYIYLQLSVSLSFIRS